METLRSATRWGLLGSLLIALLLPAPVKAQRAGRAAAKPAPDVANQKYGPHPRNVLDLWKARSDKPTPLVVYIHGGGFRGGSKESLSPALLEGLLSRGISVMAVNYRLSPEVSFPAHYMDCARALQFARSKAKEWNLDPRRVGATGGSAGAGTSLWIGFHDDMADPDNADPVLRQSTRLTCMAVQGGQSSYDPRVIKEWIGEAASKHPALPPFFGVKADEADTPRAHKIYEAASAINYLTRDDPPVYAFYSEAREIPPNARPGVGIHHVNFGLRLKEKMDQLGIECVVRHRDEGARPDKEIVEFFAKHLVPSPSRAAAASGARPNFVVIVADDLGFGDIGIHGCKDIPTPHIDSIARDGVRCTQGYVSAPQCSPTRAGLLTGRYQQRFGHEHNKSYPGSAMPLTEKTIADTLNAAGYATGLVGKWHLGTGEKHHPMNRGFDEFFGFVGGANPFLPRPGGGAIPRILRGREDAHEKEYLTDAFGREAAAFIDRHRNRPFFLYLAFNAPHMPLEATPTYLKRFEAIPDEGRRTYAAMVSVMDDAVGAVLEKLKSAGLEENTLVFFSSDNGGPERQNHSRNAPLTGVKGEVHEGGIRTPFLVRWNRRLPPGRVYDRPVIQLDIYPTALAAAGVPVPAGAKLDGVDLLPHLTGEKSGDPHEVLYWRFTFPSNRPDAPRWAIRQGEWKLLSDVDAHNPKAPPAGRTLKLINLATDPQEATDLSARHPEKAKALEAAWKKWSVELVNPAPDAGEPAKRPKRPRRPLD